MSKAITCRLIACAGTRVDPECAHAIADFGNNTIVNGYRFAMKEWLSEDQLSRSALLWVVDSATACDDVRFALRYGIPLLVPEQNPALRELCIAARCGVWYRDEFDARLCLEYLLASDVIREQLGANGRAYLAAQSSLKEGRGKRAFAAGAR